jgi:preprotein translocase subunit SecG
MNALLGTLLLLTSIFLIMLILIQRGRGGGLAGAFGGMGGQSAFGTKAGDLFTRITIGATFFWIVLCIISVKVMGGNSNRFSGGANSQGPLDDSSTLPPSTTGATGAAKSDAGTSGAATAGTGTAEGTSAGAVPGNEGKGATAPATGVDNSTGGTTPVAPAAPVAPPAANDGKAAK